MGDPNKQHQFHAAAHQLEVAANNFATRIARTAAVRAEYVKRIGEMSRSLRAAVETGRITPGRGAQIANQMRNEIMQMGRASDMDLGRVFAKNMKSKGVSLDEAIARAMKKLGVSGKQLAQLSGSQQREILLEVVDGAGRSRPAVTDAIPRLRWASRGLWVVTFAIAAYDIGTAKNPWWQSGREAANIAGGFGGSLLGGAAMGAAAGIWAGPIGVAIGALVGGILGALLTDHVYVELAGTSNPLTRQFVGRFTSVWSGVDESGMGSALASEYRHDLTFACRVFLSLVHDYTTDADDVAMVYIGYLRHDAELAGAVRRNRALRMVLIQVLRDGWTTDDEAKAIQFLQG